MTHRHLYPCHLPYSLPILFSIHVLAYSLTIPLSLIYYLHTSHFLTFFTYSPLYRSFNPLSDLFSLSLSYCLYSKGRLYSLKFAIADIRSFTILGYSIYIPPVFFLFSFNGLAICLYILYLPFTIALLSILCIYGKGYYYYNPGYILPKVLYFISSLPFLSLLYFYTSHSFPLLITPVWFLLDLLIMVLMLRNIHTVDTTIHITINTCLIISN